MFNFKPARTGASRATTWFRLVALLLATLVFPQAGLIPQSEGAGGEFDEAPLEVPGLVRTERLSVTAAPGSRRESLPTRSDVVSRLVKPVVGHVAGHVLPNGQRAPLTC